nr:MAG TPA: hypothetical protein [Inoviridae sp.]
MIYDKIVNKQQNGGQQKMQIAQKLREINCQYIIFDL